MAQPSAQTSDQVIVVLIAPTEGVVAGAPLLTGGRVVLPLATVSDGFPYSAMIDGGVDNAPAATAEAWSPTSSLYWDDTDKVFTTTATGNTACAIAMESKLPDAVTGSIRLVESTPAVVTAVTVVATAAFKVGANQVIGARDEGWTAMTGSADIDTEYAVGSVTLPQLAGRVAALQAVLTTHGLIGPTPA